MQTKPKCSNSLTRSLKIMLVLFRVSLIVGSILKRLLLQLKLMIRMMMMNMNILMKLPLVLDPIQKYLKLKNSISLRDQQPHVLVLVQKGLLIPLIAIISKLVQILINLNTISRKKSGRTSKKYLPRMLTVSLNQSTKKKWKSLDLATTNPETQWKTNSSIKYKEDIEDNSI